MVDQQTAEWIVTQRRHLHAHPELSHEEVQTRQYIEEQLKELGLETLSLTGKDVIGILNGKESGKTIGIRSDMDALPIHEETGLPFASENEGVMHACGHDGHMSILLGVARQLVERKDELDNTYVFLFQHAEETVPGGASELIDKAFLYSLDAMIGYHLWQPLEAGKFGFHEETPMAGADSFKITLQGVGGHGSMPHETVDPILVASQVITQLHTIVSRSLNPIDQAVVSIGELTTGSSYNIIPDKAYLTGTVRYFKPEVAERIKGRIQTILKGVCTSFGASFDLDYKQGDPPVQNDKRLVDIVKREAAEIYGEEQTVMMDPVLGSEDFSYYTEKIPSVYFFIGAHVNEFGHHHPKFDIEEKSLIDGVNLVTKAAIRIAKEL
ncbi:amidohydrolase [Bacillus tianshenii]|nr:amidohydrolase [Bacillus tianshenii]